MAAPTVLDLITDALGEIGVLAAGATPDANQSSHGLRRLNDLLDSLKLERLTISKVVRTLWTIVSGQQDYTVSETGVSALIDGDFEQLFYTPSGTTNSIPSGWDGVFDATNPGTIARETTIVNVGSTYSVKLTCAGGGTNESCGIKQVNVPADPSQDWTLSLYGYRQAAVFRVYVYNPDTAHYLQPGGTWAASATAYLSAVGSAGSWSQTTGSFTTESNCTTLELTIKARGSAGDVLYVDDVEFGPADSNIAIEPPPNDEDMLVTYYDSSQTTPVEFQLPLVTDEGWAGIGIKSQTSTLPTQAYYNPTIPAGTLSIWPVPTSSGLRGVVYIKTPVDEFDTLSETAVLPDGWRRMLVKNLAVELAPAYQRDVTALLIRQASESKAAVKSSNIRSQDFAFPPEALIGSGGGRFNIYTGE